MPARKVTSLLSITPHVSAATSSDARTPGAPVRTPSMEELSEYFEVSK